jgi:branched-chain amino acid transport system permease protein
MKRLFSRNNLIILAAIALLYIVVQILLVRGVLRTFHEVNLITICINIIMAVSLNLITGFTGQFSLGHAGFMAVGAYWSAVMTVKWGFFFPVSILCGSLLAAV